MADGFTFKSRAQARQYFAAVNDPARLATVDTAYAHLPDHLARGGPAAPPLLSRPNLATVQTQPYQPKPPKP